MPDKNQIVIIDESSVRLLYDPGTNKLRYYLHDSQPSFYFTLEKPLALVHFYYHSYDLVMIDKDNIHYYFRAYSESLLKFRLPREKTLKIHSKVLVSIQGDGQIKAMRLHDKKNDTNA